MHYPLISVIVPVYKVEDYLPRCVDSILAQTYPNIEIVLVDDGSPDKCGAICDEYARTHENILVVHRQNGGLSAARNTGLDVCHGEYIGFVDSDDFIGPEMYEQLYNDIVTYQTKLAFCHTNVFRNGKVVPVDYGQGTECFPKEYVLHRALAESIWWSACTKLFHQDLFDGIRFPEGKTNEDLAVMMRIYDQCDIIAVNKNKFYNYWTRVGSITTSALNVRKFDILDNAQDVATYMHEHHPDLEDPAKGILLSASLSLFQKVLRDKTGSFVPQYKKIRQILREEWPALLRNSYLSKSQRLLLTAARIHPVVFKVASYFRNLLQR